MTKFKTNFSKSQNEIPTAALPDIIFMLLFFFMVTTVLRENEDRVKYMVPNADQIKKIEKKNLVCEIIVGFPKEKKIYGTEPVIQAKGRFLNLKNVIQFVEETRSQLPEFEQDQQIILLKADKDVDMGLITDIQQELRKANARKIVYATLKDQKE